MSWSLNLDVGKPFQVSQSSAVRMWGNGAPPPRRVGAGLAGRSLPLQSRFQISPQEKQARPAYDGLQSATVRPQDRNVLRLKERPPQRHAPALTPETCEHRFTLKRASSASPAKDVA